MTFIEALLDKIMLSLPNDYKDNYDEEALGAYQEEAKTLRRVIGEKIAPPSQAFPKWMSDLAAKNFTAVKPHLQNLEILYNSLADEYSRNLLVDIIAYRILGFYKIKLSVNNATYHQQLAKMKGAIDSSKVVESGFRDWKLQYFDLNSFGINVKLYYIPLATLITFVLEQYRYRQGKVEIAVVPGDVVIDAGGCWGDTALYFANLVGEKGKVYSFEFIPKNVKFFEQNIDLNPALKPVIELVENPLWDKPGIPTYFVDNGPASQISFEKMKNADGQTETETIDHLVERKALNKVDFIKMDIEGAETFALKGAEQTIRRFKPKLAIAIYHSLEDFKAIPDFINNLQLGYKIYLGHYTMRTDETVLYAIAE